MSGYKNTVKNDNPVSFHTFDLDSQALHINQIIDEVNSNGNPMYTSGSNYRLEYISQNPLETSNQASILFAENGKLDGAWSPVWCNIPHSSDYNLDQWSIEFIIDKDYAGTIRNSGEPGYGQNIKTPIINKGSAINIYMREYYYYGYRDIVVSLFGGTRILTARQSIRHPFFELASHIAVTYDVKQTDVNVYNTSASIYINGRLFTTDSIDHNDFPPNIVSGDTWLIMGDGGNNPVTDYVTEHTAFDQLAIYGYPLTEEQISNHYRKTKTYADLIKLDYPSHYWRMDDNTILNDTMVAEVGRSATYYDSIVKHQDAMDQIIDAYSTHFVRGTAITGSNLPAMMNTNEDYTIEFWFSIAQNQRGMIFSCHEDINKYRGVTIKCNSKDDVEAKGIIQVNESSEYVLHTPDNINFTDGKWHHFVFRRKGTELILYIDGEVQDTLTGNTLGVNSTPSQLHLMSLDPSILYTNGYLSEIAMYTEALQDMQINSRIHFSTRSKIFGYTLLEGQGVSAVVRFYDDITGELIGETKSDNTGEYKFYTYSNKKMDVVALLPDNITTRYRIHAPVVPSEYDDPHL